MEIRKVFPWLKIVIMMREPISRVISYTRMWTRTCATLTTFVSCPDVPAVIMSK